MNFAFKVVGIFLWCSFQLFHLSSSIQCVDELGNAVDWLYMYKLPKDSTKNSTGDPVHEGIVSIETIL